MSRIAPIVLLVIVVAGCVQSHPLLVPDQEKLIRENEKSLKPHAALVQNNIRAADAAGALVILKDHTAPPLIVPANDPVTAASTNLDSVGSGIGCVFVSTEVIYPCRRSP
ncbi:MAG: hypothetical protein WCB10_18495 [Steroidobacteraceae bacterium]